MNTYTKMRDGSWGVRYVTSSGVLPPVAGASVAVAKRDGSVNHVTIGRVVWSDAAKGIYLCAIAASLGSAHGSGAHYERGVGRVCDECGEIARKGTRCWETGCAH